MHFEYSTAGFSQSTINNSHHCSEEDKRTCSNVEQPAELAYPLWQTELVQVLILF